MTQFPPPLRWFALGAAALLLALSGVLAFARPLPGFLPLLVLGTLVVFSEHRPVTLPSGIVVTPGFLVGMASIVVFREHGALLGPLVIGVLGGFYLPHLRRGARWWLVFNVGVVGLATVAAATAYQIVPERVVEHLPLALVAAVPPAAAFLLVEWGLLTASYALDGTRPLRDVAGEIASLSVQVCSFALLGVFLGRLYLDLGAVVAVLFVVPILVAREMFASYRRVRAGYEETLDMLVRMLEMKDRYTAGHAKRVARYALYIGEGLRLSPSRLERLRYAALMHDIGKLAIPNRLLNKPGKLTATEFERVRLHEDASYEMLSRIDFLRGVAATGRTEHMRFDPEDAGRPIEPYIVAVADAYDAMTSTRAYRRALAQPVAFEELRSKAGVQFHPACVDALISALRRSGEVHGLGHEPVAHIEWPEAPEAGVGSAGLGDLLHLGDTAGGVA